MGHRDRLQAARDARSHAGNFQPYVFDTHGSWKPGSCWFTSSTYWGGHALLQRGSPAAGSDRVLQRAHQFLHPMQQAKGMPGRAQSPAVGGPVR